MEKQEQTKIRVYWNPYFGGFLLGMLIIFTFYVTGRGLGATGALKSGVVAIVDKVGTEHAHENAYYSKFLSDEESPLNNWLVFETLGLIAGAFLSGGLNGRIGFKVQHSPKITVRRRLVFALIGGILFGLGAQIARGCTSGAALSGIAVLSVGGFITMLAIFGAAYMFAYFLRKNWI